MRTVIINTKCGETAVLTDSDIKIKDFENILPIPKQYVDALFSLFPDNMENKLIDCDVVKEIAAYIAREGDVKVLHRITVLIDEATDNNYVKILPEHIEYIGDLPDYKSPKDVIDSIMDGLGDNSNDDSFEIPSDINRDKLSKYCADAVVNKEVSVGGAMNAMGKHFKKLKEKAEKEAQQN